MALDGEGLSALCAPNPPEAWGNLDVGGVGGVRIFNLLTQEGEINHGSRPGKATLANVNHALKRLKHAVEKEGIESLALPAIATGVGGLRWDDVRPLVYDTLGELGIPITIYSTFHSGVEANEG